MKPDFFDQLAKRISQISLVIFLSGGIFLAGAYAQRKNLPPIPQIASAIRILTQEDQVDLSFVSQHLQPSRGMGAGVITPMVPDDGALVLLMGFFDKENQARLIRRDGEVVRKWSLDYFEHFPDPEARPCNLSHPLKVDPHGAHVTPQGDLVFNYEYCGTVKMDRCSAVQWTINGETHHSLIPAVGGGYWILGRQTWRAANEPDRFPPFSAYAENAVIREDTVLRVSETGEILEEHSIPKMIRDSGLEAILTSDGRDYRRDNGRRKELLHSNKVAELTADIADAFPLFEAGDLAFSMRQLNLIIVVDGETKQVKWHQTGPWLRQHDPEFRPDGRISIFNNNLYRTSYIGKQQLDVSTPARTNIIVIDPVTRETEVVFGERPGEEMLSVIRGQHELLPDNGILITEFDGGRILQVDGNRQVVWEYVNEYDADFVGELTNSKVYPAGYFENEWTSCPG